MSDKTTKELMGLAWTFSPSGLDGGFSYQALQAAASIEASKALLRVEASLLRIEHQMRSLGADGLHELIRLQVREARAKTKARRAKAKAKKAATP